jgi:hypothetical protein
MDWSRVVALCPAYTHIDYRLAGVLTSAGIRMQTYYDCSDLPRVRSELLTHGLEKTDAEVFLLIDSDIVPTTADLAAVLDSGQLGPDHAVSGAYPTRDGKLACKPMDPETAVFELGQPGLVELHAVGLGFIAIHRASLERVAVALPQLGDASAVASGRGWRPFCVPFYNGQTYYADDYSLCERLRQAGVKLWLACEALPAHVITEPRVLRPGRIAGPKAPPPPAPPAPELTPPAPSRGKPGGRKQKPAKRRR